MDLLKFCRVCLVTDVKMYSLDTTSKNSIGVIYSHLAQIQISDRYQHVCFECASLLQKYQVFKSKCLRAHNILSNIVDNSTVLTKQIIQKIDRKKNKLESNLILTPTKKYYEPHKTVKKNLKDLQPELEIKTEEYTNEEHNIPKAHDFNEKCFIDIDKTAETTNENKNNSIKICISSNECSNRNTGHNLEILERDTEDNKTEYKLIPKAHTDTYEESKIISKTKKINKNSYKSNLNIPVKESLKYKIKKGNKKNEITGTDLTDINNDSAEEFDDNSYMFLNESSDEYVEEEKSITDKTNNIKHRKSKKRKVTTVIFSDNDDISDNEPLSKNVNKINNKKNKRLKEKSRLNLEFEDYATVALLTNDDAKNELLVRKESKNYKISQFKCDFCYKGYEVKAAYDNHMKRHSAENGEYECDICHLRFPKSVFLCKHKLSCHKRKFSCKLCPYICYCMNQARTHVSLHKGKKYPCKDCGEIFSMPNSLFMHKRLKHLNVAVAESICELCGDIFGSPRGLFLHHNKLHRTEKNNKQGPKCEDCDIHFSTEFAWKRHLVLSARHIVTNGCKYCGERFTNEDDLKSHVRANHQRMSRKKTEIELPAACPLCKEWLSNRIEYKTHMNTEHPQSEEAMKLSNNLASYVCEVCGKAFKLQCFLIYHQRKHTGERPYKCQDCGKTFQMSGSLSIHRTVHTQKPSYKCDTCSKVFSSKSALNKHMKLHLGIRPHKCNICDKGFLHMCDLRLHIKYVHDKVPWPKKKSKRNVADENASYVDYN